jgi:acyl-CoA hydrolase
MSIGCTRIGVELHKQQRNPIKLKSYNNRSTIQSNNIPINKINQIIYNKTYTQKNNKTNPTKTKKPI